MKEIENLDLTHLCTNFVLVVENRDSKALYELKHVSFFFKDI